MTAELLTKLSGILVSLVFSYVPVVNSWYYNKLPKEWRGLFMAGVMLLITVLFFVFGCYGMFNIQIDCTSKSVESLVTTYFWALLLNQGTYLVTPESPAK